jgi:hypothetical protein
MPCSSLNVRLLCLLPASHAGLLFGLFFDPDDGGNMFLRNVRWVLANYTALYRQR